jgi:hypothetical protein
MRICSFESCLARTPLVIFDHSPNTMFLPLRKPLGYEILAKIVGQLFADALNSSRLELANILDA